MPRTAIEFARYAAGAFYEPHHDFFAAGGASTTPAEPAFTPPHGSNRFATAVVYLSSADTFDDGGLTVSALIALIDLVALIECID